MKYEELSQESKEFVDEMARIHGKTRDEVMAQFNALQESDCENAAGLLS